MSKLRKEAKTAEANREAHRKRELKREQKRSAAPPKKKTLNVSKKQKDLELNAKAEMEFDNGIR